MNFSAFLEHHSSSGFDDDDGNNKTGDKNESHSINRCEPPGDFTISHKVTLVIHSVGALISVLKTLDDQFYDGTVNEIHDNGKYTV